MKRLLPLLLLVSSVAGFSQQPAAVAPSGVIERVDFSGIAETRLSTELRADIQKLVGQTYNAAVVSQLAEGIQIELPEYVAAVTTQFGSQPDRIRIILVVAKISDNDALKTNINARYIVDAVQVAGSYKSKISDALQKDLQSMVGKNLDNTRADELRDRILKENTSDTDPDAIYIKRKLRRSDSPQHVKVIYEVEQANNNINFTATDGVYHSQQGFSAPTFNLNASTSPVPGTFSVTIANDPHPLIERFAGWKGGYSIGRDAVRFGATYSSYRAQWKENTLQAAAQTPNAPGLYRLRDTVETFVRLTLPLQLKARAGVDLIQLQMQSPVPGFQKDRVLNGTLEGRYSTPKSEIPTAKHAFGWSYGVRTGTRVLGSDFVYTRHELTAEYNYEPNVFVESLGSSLRHSQSKSKVTASLLAGRATGNAPMFERFSLGNAIRLRGWNKYEIDPLGGNRVLYGSGSYTYSFVSAFYDIGAVWDAHQSSITRQSAGFSLGSFQCKGAQRIIPFCWMSLTVGFPIHGGGERPSIIIGM